MQLPWARAGLLEAPAGRASQSGAESTRRTNKKVCLMSPHQKYNISLISPDEFSCCFREANDLSVKRLNRPVTTPMQGPVTTSHDVDLLSMLGPISTSGPQPSGGFQLGRTLA